MAEYLEYQTGAYRWLNKVNGKCYVGGAYKTFEGRRKSHLRDLRKNKHPNRHLQGAWNKYGESSFEFQIVERCEPIKAKVIDCEQKRIDFYKAADDQFGYNLSPTANSCLGVKFSPESCARISAGKTGIPLTEEHRERIREFQNRPEVIAKKSEITSKAWLDTILVEKMCRGRKGRKHIEKALEKMRKARNDPI